MTSSLHFAFKHPAFSEVPQELGGNFDIRESPPHSIITVDVIAHAKLRCSNKTNRKCSNKLLQL